MDLREVIRDGFSRGVAMPLCRESDRFCISGIAGVTLLSRISFLSLVASSLLTMSWML